MIFWLVETCPNLHLPKTPTATCITSSSNWAKISSITSSAYKSDLAKIIEQCILHPFLTKFRYATKMCGWSQAYVQNKPHGRIFGPFFTMFW